MCVLEREAGGNCVATLTSKEWREERQRGVRAWQLYRRPFHTLLTPYLNLTGCMGGGVQAVHGALPHPHTLLCSPLKPGGCTWIMDSCSLWQMFRSSYVLLAAHMLQQILSKYERLFVTVSCFRTSFTIFLCCFTKSVYPQLSVKRMLMFNT